MMSSKQVKSRFNTVIARAEDSKLAKEYVEQLMENGINAKIERPTRGRTDFGVGIIISQDDYEKAYEVIQDMRDRRDFYDYLCETGPQDFITGDPEWNEEIDPY